MKLSLKSVLILVMPLCVLLFVQAEEGRLRITEHKAGYFTGNHADFTADADDDSISLSAADEDGDDVSENLVRLLPVVIISPTISSFVEAQSVSSLPTSKRISYRDNSSSFLRVFRI